MSGVSLGKDNYAGRNSIYSTLVKVKRFLGRKALITFSKLCRLAAGSMTDEPDNPDLDPDSHIGYTAVEDKFLSEQIKKFGEVFWR